jgi:hypothetical protein
MRRALALLLCAVLGLFTGAARADEPQNFRLSVNGSLRFIPVGNALPAAEALARTGDEDRAWVARDIGADYEGVTDIYVTLDDVAFLASQPPDALAPSWASGVAYPRLNRIVLKLGPKEANPRAILRHELSHISIGRLTNYRAPRWLLEGIAVLHAGDAWNSEGPSLMKAALSDRLFPFDALAMGFPAAPSDAEVAYAQSADFVKYLTDRFGEEKLHEILREMVGGVGFDEAVYRVLGAPPLQLETQWRQSLNRWEMLFRLVASYEFILGFTVLLALAAWWRLRRRRQLHLQLMEREEQAEAMRALLREPALWADQLASDEESSPTLSVEDDDADEEEDDRLELGEDDLPDELFARREPPPPKKPTIH